MLRLIVSQMRRRRGRTLALLLGIAVATASFTVLTGVSDSQRLETRGSVAQRFRTAYDVLVRPRGSRARMEAKEGLVQPNFLSGIFGGITMGQYERIRRIPGVEVAAPIAMIGYVLPVIDVPLPSAGVPSHRELFRISVRRVADRGLTSIPDADSYLYATDRPLRPVGGFVADSNVPGAYEALGGGRQVPVCPFDAQSLFDSPFAPAARAKLTCWSRITGEQGLDVSGNGAKRGGAAPQASVSWSVPFLIAAIDPDAEARLTGLDRALAAGRYLRSGDAPRRRGAHGRLPRLTVPVLVAEKPYLDEASAVAIQRLPTRAADKLPATSNPGALWRLLRRQPEGPVVAHSTVNAGEAYQRLLLKLRTSVDVDGYWTSSPVHYRRLGSRSLAPRPVSNPPAVWSSTYQSLSTAFVRAPLTAADRNFRRLTQHGYRADARFPIPAISAVGTFDAGRIAAFATADSGPLSAYSVPEARPGDARAGRLLGGAALRPSTNFAGYLTPPPLLLTTLKALTLFTNSTYFGGVDRVAAAPISAVRIRVAGVKGPDAVSRERIRLVAQRIAQTTGLDVDITAGASPTPVGIALPAGRFGRPPLHLQESWIKKGVAVAILRALDRKSLILFALILVVCALFTANAAAAAVRHRRTELGVLACVGWRPRHLFMVIVLELALVGLSAGLAGSVIALVTSSLLGLQASAVRAVLAIPAATLLAVVAAIWPAFVAARSDPATAVRPAVNVRSRRAGAGRTLLALAVTNVLRVPGRSLLAASSLAVGVFALTVLLALALAFRGAVVGSLLGDAVAVQARRADYVAVGAMLMLGAGAVADVLYLSVRERSVEFATLRATGWRDSALARLVVWEGLIVGLAGALAGALLGALAAWVFAGALPASIVLVAGIAVIAGTGLAAVSALLPAAATTLHRQPIAATVAQE